MFHEIRWRKNVVDAATGQRGNFESTRWTHSPLNASASAMNAIPVRIDRNYSNVVFLLTPVVCLCGCRQCNMQSGAHIVAMYERQNNPQPT